MSWKYEDEHICKRVLERLSKKFKDEDEVKKELSRIKKVLGNNVSDDWRLTRFSSDFLIRDLETGITLIGYQARRFGSTEIIKNVGSALVSGGFSRAKLVRHAGSPIASDIAKRPNLFIGSNAIDEIFNYSPILARQYEKVVYKTLETEFKIRGEWLHKSRVSAKNPIEYFRLHPLTKDGLDREHYIWLKWVAINGYCHFIHGEPPNNYHGEDFWSLEER